MSSRCVFVMRRRPDISVQRFEEMWRGPHAALVARYAKTLGLVGYTQLHTVRRSLTNTVLKLWRGLLDPYDGIDVWWLDRAAFAAALEREDGQRALEEIVASERGFVDHARSSCWLAEAHLFRDEQRPTRGPVRKLVWVGRGLAPRSDREFLDHYFHSIGPLVAKSAPAMGIHRYLQVCDVRDAVSDELRRVRGTGEPYPVSAELTWDMTAIFRGGPAGSLAASAVARAEKEAIDFARSAIWQADEHVVLEPPVLTPHEPSGPSNTPDLRAASK